jgi:hypothetical protein
MYSLPVFYIKTFSIDLHTGRISIRLNTALIKSTLSNITSFSPHGCCHDFRIPNDYCTSLHYYHDSARRARNVFRGEAIFTRRVLHHYCCSRSNDLVHHIGIVLMIGNSRIVKCSRFDNGIFCRGTR